jgi:hypothetical protein
MIDRRNFLKTYSIGELSGDKHLNEQLHRNLEHKCYIEKTDLGYVYKCEFLVGKFQPTEFKIKLKENNLEVEASREMVRAGDFPQTSLSSIDNNTSSVYYDNNRYSNNTAVADGADGANRFNFLNFKEIESFKREITVPNFVDLDSLSCYLETYENFQNVLVVEGLIQKKFQLDEFFEQQQQQQQQQDGEQTGREYAGDRITISDEPKPVINKSPTQCSSSSSSSSSRSSCNSGTKRYGGGSGVVNEAKLDSSITNSGYLKYKFDLAEFDSNNITITVRNKTILNVNAFKFVYDSNGRKQIEQFNHDINLPENVQIHNIKNCFDENDGILRIEIPLNNDNDHFSNSNANSPSHGGQPKVANRKRENAPRDNNEKYLELMFDLYDFKFDRIDVRPNVENKKILVVRALKVDENGRLENRPYIRKYILPDWVDSENMIVNQDRQIVDGEIKNLLIVQIAIKE